MLLVKKSASNIFQLLTLLTPKGFDASPLNCEASLRSHHGKITACQRIHRRQLTERTTVEPKTAEAGSFFVSFPPKEQVNIITSVSSQLIIICSFAWSMRGAFWETLSRLCIGQMKTSSFIPL
jgi:hypothetical protein